MWFVVVQMIYQPPNYLLLTLNYNYNVQTTNLQSINELNSHS